MPEPATAGRTRIKLAGNDPGHKMIIRETTPEDLGQISDLYPQAFPDEPLTPLVSDLLEQGSAVLSLAAFDKNALVAHLLFTFCGTDTDDRSGALLGPLAVAPSHQRRGLGSALVRAGLERLEPVGVRQVFVLGDPAYYRRFGFTREGRVLAPYPIPDHWAEAWQSRSLGARSALSAGPLLLPEPWMQPDLWGDDPEANGASG